MTSTLFSITHTSSCARCFFQLITKSPCSVIVTRYASLTSSRTRLFLLKSISGNATHSWLNITSFVSYLGFLLALLLQCSLSTGGFIFLPFTARVCAAVEQPSGTCNRTQYAYVWGMYKPHRAHFQNLFCYSWSQRGWLLCIPTLFNMVLFVGWLAAANFPSESLA